ncbi:D-2-hydroxyacid dehydrogenase [[Clostridium] spiroforme]|nr:D-2-hydroxyacid dehydrogenase [Thomasclavelia spiroformis]MBM6879385.1 D-2-hydroxyacid dehydrogenase [Thomasclavelia spiroformis]
MKILIENHLTVTEKQKIYDTFPEDEFIEGAFSQEHINEADVIIGNPSLKLQLNQPHLKALLLNSAGSDAYCQKDILHPDTVLCNASGSYGKCLAEYTVGMMITVAKQFRHFANLQDQHIWGNRIGGKEIYHSRVLIVGFGDIGYECAKRLKAFHCTIAGIKRRMIEKPDVLDELYTMEELDSQLKLADYVILALPHSSSTYHIMNQERLLLMKKDAILINVGRGSAVDTDALVAVLQQGHLFGAGLDVVEQEPLPEDHPLWSFDNVTLTPHVAGSFSWDSVREFFVELTIANLHHLHHGEPLENVVDRRFGYRYETIYHR